MIIEVTKAQLDAIINLKEDAKSMLGGSDNDAEWNRYILLIERMLKKNKK